MLRNCQTMNPLMMTELVGLEILAPLYLLASTPHFEGGHYLPPYWSVNAVLFSGAPVDRVPIFCCYICYTSGFE